MATPTLPRSRVVAKPPGVARRTVALVRAAVSAWWSSDALPLGAALAYYTVFSLAPVLVVAIAVAGFVLGEDAARDGVARQLDGAIGRDAAQAIGAVVEKASIQQGASAAATAFALATILLGASGAFGQLQQALNRIWECAPPVGGLRSVLRRRLVSFGGVLCVGLLLLVSLLASAAIAALGAFAPTMGPAIPLARFGVSLAIEVLLFAAVFKLLPDARIAWADVWIGAAVTAVLFEAGKSAIAYYLAHAGVVSMYGAAGSLVALLLWVYYSAQILFFGASFTRVWSERRRAVREGA